MRSGIVQILHNIPVVPLSNLINNALMLHFTMTEEDIKSNDILFQTSPVDSKSKLNPANLELYNNDQVRTVEQMLLQFVRKAIQTITRFGNRLLRRLTHPTISKPAIPFVR